MFKCIVIKFSMKDFIYRSIWQLDWSMVEVYAMIIQKNDLGSGNLV